ncbi:MAG: hypothetical protein Fur0018_02990 [Anaerolineales bacterium]
MRINTPLIAESPIYRGNARKTLFTRDGDGKQRLVSLAGEIQGTAQSLMDAFIGESRNGRNEGLLPRLWKRLYGEKIPNGLIKSVQCNLQSKSYPADHFFDLRMGIKLDEDRWAVEANANYKYETVFRNARFDFSMEVNDQLLAQGENRARLYYLLNELAVGRFWFGAGKSKGLGRVRLEWQVPENIAPPAVHPQANHMNITLRFDARNPILVGWNWGKIDPNLPAFVALEGRILVEAMRILPLEIRERLSMVMGGPILTPDDWKHKLADYLPRALAIDLREHSVGEHQAWRLSSSEVEKLGKGKYALSKDVLAAVRPLLERPFESQEALQSALEEVLGNKANMAKRIAKTAKAVSEKTVRLNEELWERWQEALGFDETLHAQAAETLEDEAAITEVFRQACKALLPRLYEQVDQQIKLSQSDAWVDQELENRRAHLKIKQMLRDRKINEAQWEDRRTPPQGISLAQWQEFLAAHERVRFQHIVNPRNLEKSIVNDQNFIRFLEGYRNKTRQELAQAYNTDYRGGGSNGREISRAYGKPYDTVFMRMLSLSPARQGNGAWEAYIPGSTLKGAFRKRAAQVLKTVWGETRRTQEMLDALFGVQGRIGRVFFSDAYLLDPDTPDQVWSSMDGVRMNPATGQPVESAKSDYLFAYGHDLVFQCRLDIQDITPQEIEAIGILAHLLEDARRGDVVIGGSKTAGFGWIQPRFERLSWYTGDPEGDLTRHLFGEAALARDGLWHSLHLNDEQAAQVVHRWAIPISNTGMAAPAKPRRASDGFISHRSFGGHSGMLYVRAEVLTPLSIRESGAPSFQAKLNAEPINGWDFYAITPPDAQARPAEWQYAIPAKSIKGLIRHMYSIVSDSKETGRNLHSLTPVEHLFGFVGQGPNQALMGRLAFSFAPLDSPTLTWYNVPYPYGEWRYANDQWLRTADDSALVVQIDKTWRLFPHVPLAPVVRTLDDFAPDKVQAAYFRAASPGTQAHFNIRFWNLEDEELQRLLWCVALEPNLAHKMGHHRYLGFGSIRFHVLPESYLIDWSARYAAKPESAWQMPLDASRWHNPKAIFHYRALKNVLNADTI